MQPKKVGSSRVALLDRKTIKLKDLVTPGSTAHTRFAFGYALARLELW